MDDFIANPRHLQGGKIMARKLMEFEIDNEKSMKKINDKIDKGWVVIDSHKMSDNDNPSNVFVAVLEKKKANKE